MTRTARRVLVASIVVGVLVWGAAPGLRFTTSFSPGLLVFGVGLLLALSLLGYDWHRSQAQRLAGEARGDARRQLAAEHDRFVRRLDHELKNPITAINAALVSLEPDRPSVKVVHNQVLRLSSLVGELRKVAEVRSVPLALETVSIQRILADVQAALDCEGSQYRPTKRTLRIDFPAAPWHVSRVQADPDLIYLALFNVLSNAVKYTSPKDTIEVRASDDGSVVTIEVADTGIGIPQEELSLVWEELARGSNSQWIPGSGLGLSLIQVIMERHGGTATLISRQSMGTKVTLTLPIEGPSDPVNPLNGTPLEH